VLPLSTTFRILGATTSLPEFRKSTHETHVEPFTRVAKEHVQESISRTQKAYSIIRAEEASPAVDRTRVKYRMLSCPSGVRTVEAYLMAITEQFPEPKLAAYKNKMEDEALISLFQSTDQNHTLPSALISYRLGQEPLHAPYSCITH
jgi:hypothetical protein